MNTAKGELDDMKTLSSCSRSLDKLGFTTQFKVNGCNLKSLDTEKEYEPSQIKVVNFYRFEGASNPDDNAILYAIETNDGERGTLTDAYGAYGDPNIAAFIQQVDNIEKKVDKDKSL